MGTPTQKKRWRIRPGRIAGWTALILLVIVTLLPFVWALRTALTPNADIFNGDYSLIPRNASLINFKRVLGLVSPEEDLAAGGAGARMYFWLYLRNSLIFTGLLVLGQLVTSTMAAYAFARLRFKGRDHLFMLFLGTLVLPQEVLVIPLYIGMQRMGLVNSYFALIVPFAFGAFGAFLIRQFLMSLPLEFEEAARIDGCSDWKILTKILLPLLKAPITVVGVFAFIDYWSAFLWPLIVVNDSSLATIPLGLQMFSGERGTDWGPLMAAVTMTTIPSILLVVFLQKQLEKGVTLGAFGGR